MESKYKREMSQIGCATELHSASLFFFFSCFSQIHRIFCQIASDARSLFPRVEMGAVLNAFDQQCFNSIYCPRRWLLSYSLEENSQVWAACNCNPPSWLQSEWISHGEESIYSQNTGKYHQERTLKLTFCGGGGGVECTSMRQPVGAIFGMITPDYFLPFCFPYLSRKAQSCRDSRADEANPGPFVQMKLFSRAIFQCHIYLCLIHEVGLSRWRHLSSSSGAAGLSWPLSCCSRETDASEEHLSVKDSRRLCYIYVFNQPQSNLWI